MNLQAYEGPCVIVIHNSIKYVISKQVISNSNRYWREFRDLDTIVINDQYSEEQFTNFVHFLSFMDTKFDESHSLSIYNLLRDWEFNLLIMQYFRNKVIVKEKNGTIMCRNEYIRVNHGLLLHLSETYREFHELFPHSIFELPDCFNIDSIKCFLEIMSNCLDSPPLEHVDQVKEICRYMKCGSFEVLWKQNQFEMVLSKLLPSQNSCETDFEDYEQIICSHLTMFMDYPQFVTLPIPTLIRVFQLSQQVQDQEKMFTFVKSIINYSGILAHSFMHSLCFSFSEKQYDEIVLLLIDKCNSSVYLNIQSFLQKNKLALECTIEKITNENSNNNSLLIDQYIQSIASKEQEILKIKNQKDVFEANISVLENDKNQLKDQIISEQQMVIDLKNKMAANTKEYEEKLISLQKKMEDTIYRYETQKEKYQFDFATRFESQEKVNEKKISRYEKQIHEMKNKNNEIIINQKKEISELNEKHKYELLDSKSKFESQISKERAFSKLQIDNVAKKLNENRILCESIEEKRKILQEKYNGIEQQLEVAKKENISLTEERNNLLKELKKKPETLESNIHIAAMKGDIISLRYLIENGVDINSLYTLGSINGFNMNGATPLHFACMANNLNTVMYLVDHNANVNCISREVFTPLLFAEILGHLEICQYLKTKGGEKKTFYE